MLYEFLEKNQEEILAATERKSLDLAGVRPSSEQLKKGLPIFYKQLLFVLRLEGVHSEANIRGMSKAASENDEPALAKAGGRPGEVELAREAGFHGVELLRLGYTLSHVVHAYGAMCQAITELATAKDIVITSAEFRDLNRCLDVAIAGAVTEYQALRNTQNVNREVEHLGFLAHELRNALVNVNVSIQLIEEGTVGFSGSTGRVLKKGLKQIQELVDRSLTEVRLRIDPQVHPETICLIQVIDQIIVTATVEAQSRKQVLEIQVDPNLVFEADLHLMFSALSNLIQNALKYTPPKGKVQVRAKYVEDHIVIEVEDECGGLAPDVAATLFKPFVQQHENRKGLGLGLTIAQRAVHLNHGTIEVINLPKKGCVFKITLPRAQV